MLPTQESCLIGRLRVGLLRGEGELSEAEKKGLLSFSSILTGLCASGSEGDKNLTGGIKQQREVNREETGGETEKRKRKSLGRVVFLLFLTL